MRIVSAILGLPRAYRIAAGVGVLAMVLGGAAWVGAHRYNDRLRAEGRREAESLVLEAFQRAAKQSSAKLDTVYIEKRQTFTRTVNRWKTDTIRERILAQPDTSLVPVTEYRRLSFALDSTVIAADAALSAADSLLRAERLRIGLLETRIATQLPTIVYPPPDKWKNRGKGALVGALATLLVLEVVKK